MWADLQDDLPWTWGQHSDDPNRMRGVRTSGRMAIVGTDGEILKPTYSLCTKKLRIVIFMSIVIL